MSEYITPAPTGIIPFVPFLGTDGTSSNLSPWLFLAGGAVLALGAVYLFGKKSRSRRRRRPPKILTPRPLSRSKFDVVVGKTLSRHTSEQGAAREARRFTRRGIRATIKRVR